MKDPLRIEVPLAVAMGGAIGAVARWGLAESMPQTDGFPLPTFIANVGGSLLLGIVLVLGERFHPKHHRAWARLWRPFLATGVLGGFTTFSTFALELVRVEPLVAVGYLVSSALLGLLAFGLGNAYTRRVTGIAA